MNTATGHVEVDQLSVRFPGSRGGPVFDAVVDASIEVRPGEFVSIIGPSGCGKSTLLNAVAGFIERYDGAVRLDGAPIRKPGPDRVMVFQHASLFPWQTVQANVEFGLKMKGVEKSVRTEQAQTLLGWAGLRKFEHHYPEQLSGGMRQRVALLRALAMNPQVLLMDEPFGALDAQTRITMQEALMEMWQRFRMSVLFVTHDIDEAIFLSDRVYVMTAHPGTIKTVLEIALPRPRTIDMTTTEAFQDLKRAIFADVREESLKALAEAPAAAG